MCGLCNYVGYRHYFADKASLVGVGKNDKSHIEVL